MDATDYLRKYADHLRSIVAKSVTASPPAGRVVHHALWLYSELIAMEAVRPNSVDWRVDGSVLSAARELEGGVWPSLVRHVAGEMSGDRSLMDLARKDFEQVILRQQSNGAFIAPDRSKNPETRWYEELVTLHAVTSYGVRVQDPFIQSAVARAARFHLEEIQPDHATAEPWGLLAYMQHAPALADQVLHAMLMQYPQGVSGVPLLLLRDVLYGLRRLTDGSNT